MDQAQLQALMAQYLRAMGGQEQNPIQSQQQMAMQQLQQPQQMGMGGFRQPQMPQGGLAGLGSMQGNVGRSF